MAALSTLVGGSQALAHVTLRRLRPELQQLLHLRHGHAHVFRKRPGQLIVNRLKDVGHFYLIGLGLLPISLIVAYTHIVYGPSCELKDFPTDGTVPHYWQYERTPLRQWFARNLGYSDVALYERNLAYWERNNIRQRWRRAEERVRHLQGERWDYKGWHYDSASAAWVDYARYQAEWYRDKYEKHGHYSF